MLCGENLVSEKLKIVCSVTESRLGFVSVPTADLLQPSFAKLPCVEQRITKLDSKSTIFIVCNYCTQSSTLSFEKYIFIRN